MARIKGVHGFVHPMPIGSVDEIRESGFDLGMVGSCAPKGGPKDNVKGCQFHADCPFKFRDTRPRNVAFRMIKPSGKIKEKEVSCYRWMSSYHTRAMEGDIDAEVFGDENSMVKGEDGKMKPLTIAITGSEPRYPDEPKNKARKKFAKEMPIPKFPTIEEAFPEEIQSAKTQEHIARRRQGKKIFSNE